MLHHFTDSLVIDNRLERAKDKRSSTKLRRYLKFRFNTLRAASLVGVGVVTYKRNKAVPFGSFSCGVLLSFEPHPIE